MPQKIRDLLKALKDAGFAEIAGVGKGSHRKLVHPKYHGAVTLSGKASDDAKRYQERQVALPFGTDSDFSPCILRRLMRHAGFIRQIG